MPRGGAKVYKPADPPLEPEVHEHIPSNNLTPFRPGHVYAAGANKGNKGRPPSYVRAASRMGYLTRIPMLKRIADGVEYRTVILEGKDKEGNSIPIEIKVYPTLQERMKAVDILAKYGGLVVVREEEDEEDDEPGDTPIGGFDFSQLDDKQLEVLHNLLALAKKPEQLTTGE